MSAAILCHDIYLYRHQSAFLGSGSQTHLSITSKKSPSRQLFYVEAAY
jgi:hypothetical protein